ncbi:hypothetical protein INT43_002774 [Umbelopsis isabellina]|uniref:EVE domain-containing protein n=1 Tax=Mortierella isabellina TaxID=91625 RepID=A0A8H7UHR9_MORIS|nr:hypothetical protein INT43_002774 [Umbelopsis isabellina]
MPPTLRNRKPKDDATNDKAAGTKVSKAKTSKTPTQRNEVPVAKPVKSRKRGKAEATDKAEVKDEEDQENKVVKNKKSKTKQDVKPEGMRLANKMSNSERQGCQIQHRRLERYAKQVLDLSSEAENDTSQWDGVRNFEARNIMRDRMKIGHKVLFYHSNCKIPGVAGIAEIVREGYEDSMCLTNKDTAFDEKHPYHDPKSDKSNPKWFMVDVKFVRKLKRLLPLKELQSYPQLSQMALIKRGRLSVQPVTEEEYNFILSQEDRDVSTT